MFKVQFRAELFNIHYGRCRAGVGFYQCWPGLAFRLRFLRGEVFSDLQTDSGQTQNDMGARETLPHRVGAQVEASRVMGLASFRFKKVCSFQATWVNCQRGPEKAGDDGSIPSLATTSNA
jgi:hypothetical protein